MSNHKPLIVTYAEAGKILMGISARSVRRIVKNGDLPYVKVGGACWYPL
ncbi:MAG: helix-turn-helix domain-containing protein [Candidatus Thiodiazotropha endolucinida]